MADIVTSSDCRSQGCRDWVAAGRPWAPAKPMAKLATAVSGHGFTVYMKPDRSHLTAARPEDHTSFSVTGYPTQAPRWYGNAADIMPRGSDHAALVELERLARQIIADKRAKVAGTEFIKYMNWTTADASCYQTSWTTSGVETQRPSTDKGHIHISGLSTWVTQDSTPYDPVARMSGGGQEDEDSMGASLGPIEIQREGTTSLSIPPVEAGLADPREAWFNIGNDTNDEDYAVRIQVSNGTGPTSWTSPGHVQLIKLKSGQRSSVQLPAGTAIITLSRKAIDKDGNVVEPTDTLKPYAGFLTCCIERGPVKKAN